MFGDGGILNLWSRRKLNVVSGGGYRQPPGQLVAVTEVCSDLVSIIHFYFVSPGLAGWLWPAEQ